MKIRYLAEIQVVKKEKETVHIQRVDKQYALFCHVKTTSKSIIIDMFYLL
jgi:hypothetical protein